MRAVAVLVALTLGLVAVPRPVTSQASAEPPRRITGNNIVPPTKVKDVPPVYPPEARQSGVSRVVIIETTIGEDGKVRDARVLRSIPLLDQAALDAVKQWEYTPTIVEGKPRAVIMTATVNFTTRGVAPVGGNAVAGQAAVPAAQPAPGLVRVFAYHPPNGGSLVAWDITQARATSLPHWTPDTDVPPLTTVDATQLARAWLAGRYPQVPRFDLQSASLIHIRRSPNIDFWYYRLDFFSGTPQVTGPLFVVVLPDGTVAEPAGTGPAAAPAPQPQVFQPGAGITSPRLLRDVKAKYTEEALRRKIAGTVAVQGVVGLEHFPLVLSTRPWYFSRSGGADGRAVFDGPTNPRAEGF
jgi:TonB family protein